MNPIKRLGLVGWLAVGATLLASTAARAKDTHTYELANVCDSGDQDADATGQVTYGEWTLVGHRGGEWWECSVAISCQNLTPGATYGTPVGTFTANTKGKGKVSGYLRSLDYWGPWIFVYVSRLNADASWTGVLWGAS